VWACGSARGANAAAGSAQADDCCAGGTRGHDRTTRSDSRTSRETDYGAGRYDRPRGRRKARVSGANWPTQ